MNRKEVISIISKITEIKRNVGFKIIDSHVHPLDVMGVSHYEDIKWGYNKIDYFAPGLLERFNFGRIEKIASRIAFKLFSRQINNIILKTFDGVNEDRIVYEMDAALVDNAVVVPIEPWLPTKIVADKFVSERFKMLGSVDIHNIALKDIENTLESFIEKYKIIGIKLHPNLQNFKPQPSHNSKDLAEKLHKIYSISEKRKLYLLFHGGISNYTNIIDHKYEHIGRNKTNALLENFCNNNGESELFGKYNIPIVIAHLGHYGVLAPNYKLMKLITQRFDNVYFDTTGASPYFIRDTLRLISSKKIIFGSDAIYNRMTYSLSFLYLAAENAKNGESLESILLNTLQENFLKIMSS